MIAQALLLVALAGPPARAAAVQPQAQPKASPRRPVRVLPGVDVELKTKDGWTLAARYSAPKDPALPVFILLHEVGGRKENWYFLARAMAKKGIGYLALDFRGHGGSQSPPPGQPEHWRKFPDPTRLHGAAEYLQSQKVEVSSIALGGADVGSSIALKWAAVHPAAPMVFLLSPGMSYHEVLTVNAMRVYNKRPILMVVGADDNHSTRARHADPGRQQRDHRQGARLDRESARGRCGRAGAASLDRARPWLAPRGCPTAAAVR